MLYHLFAIWLAPNAQNYMGQKLTPYFRAYLETLALTNAWSFFAPDPGPPPIFVEYEVLGPGGGSLGKYRWPEEKSPYFLRERQNRRVAAAAFMTMGNNRVEKLILPIACHAHPEANSIRISFLVYPPRDLEPWLKNPSSYGPDADVDRRFVSHEFCSELGQMQGKT